MLARVLLTDVDNTLFSWIGYFAPSFRGMVHAIARKGDFDEDELFSHFKLTYQREGTVEFKKAIQSNDLIASLDPGAQAELVELGAGVFSRTMRKYLRPYDGVKSTLIALQRDGVKVVAVTNSDAMLATYRLRQLGLAKLVDGLVAWRSESPGLLGQDTADDYDQKLAERVARSGVAWVEAVPTSDTKPSTVAYEVAMARLGLRSADVWVVGDSQSKDLTPAEALGFGTVWAAYGQVDKPADVETLLRITHWSEDRIKTTYETNRLTPDHAIQRFDELERIIPLDQAPLF